MGSLNFPDVVDDEHPRVLTISPTWVEDFRMVEPSPEDFTRVGYFLALYKSLTEAPFYDGSPMESKITIQRTLKNLFKESTMPVSINQIYFTYLHLQEAQDQENLQNQGPRAVHTKKNMKPLGENNS